MYTIGLSASTNSNATNLSLNTDVVTIALPNKIRFTPTGISSFASTNKVFRLINSPSTLILHTLLSTSSS